MWDDRTLAQQLKVEVDAACGGTDDLEPYVDEIVCNCSTSGTWAISAEDPSYRYVGRMGTFLPYVRCCGRPIDRASELLGAVSVCLVFLCLFVVVVVVVVVAPPSPLSWLSFCCTMVATVPTSTHGGRTHHKQGFYRTPLNSYPGKTPNGENWSTPRNGSCAEVSGVELSGVERVGGWVGALQRQRCKRSESNHGRNVRNTQLCYNNTAALTPVAPTSLQPWS